MYVMVYEDNIELFNEILAQISFNDSNLKVAKQRSVKTEFIFRCRY